MESIHAEAPPIDKFGHLPRLYALASHQSQGRTDTHRRRDAEIPERLGAIGALRALVKVGQDTRYSAYSSALPVLQQLADELPSKLNLLAVQHLTASRVRALNAFIIAIQEEAGELLF